MNHEACARDHFLVGPNLRLYEDSIPWILNHIDCFVSQRRGNESVKDVYSWPHAFHGHEEDGWNKVGQTVGNLLSLETFFISTLGRTNSEHGPDWEERYLACILSRVRRKVRVELDGLYQWPVGKDRRSLERFMDTLRLQVLWVVEGFRTNLWIHYIRHWQHYQLWSLSDFL
jgi:hypothetical protein